LIPARFIDYFTLRRDVGVFHVRNYAGPIAIINIDVIGILNSGRKHSVRGFFVPHYSLDLLARRFNRLRIRVQVRDCKKFLAEIFFESLILAQDERWRCVLGMQVERSDVKSDSGRRVSNA
jgi:hypothetical protein